MTTTLESPRLPVAGDPWNAALAALERHFTRPIFEMWVKPLRPVALDGGELTLAATSGFAREWVESRLKPEIRSVLGNVFGAPVELRVVVAEPPPAADVATNSTSLESTSPATPALHVVDPPASSVLNTRYTFDSFVTGESNRFAHAAAMAVATAPARAYNPLFLYGGPGLGKTHLLHAIGNRVVQENRGASVVYVTCEKFTNEFIAAVQRNETDAFRQRYRGVDVLLIDDVQFLADRETTQDEFFFTFNALHEAGRQIVLTSDRPPKEIRTLEARLRSRFEWGLIADVQMPDVTLREAVLRKKAEALTVAVPETVLTMIARVVPSNVRELEGALLRVTAFASSRNAAVTLDLAQEALRNVAIVSNARVTIAKIKETVASAHGLTVRELENTRREQRIAAPRQVAMYLATELTSYSLPQLARDFGKKDHTTVMYARDKVRSLMATDEAYRRKIQQLAAVCQTL